MAITNLNSEDRLVQKTFADVLHNDLGWDSVYAWTQEIFGLDGTLGRLHERTVVLVRDLRAALERLNPELPNDAVDQAVDALTATSTTRTLVQQNQEKYRLIRNGVPVSYKDEQGKRRDVSVRVIDFRNPEQNRFLVVREFKVQGLNVPYYNRRADLVCFINGLPVVVIECKAVYKDIRDGFEDNLTDYTTDAVIPHLFHHNAFLVVTNGEHAKYGSITSGWEHFNDWKRNDEKEDGQLDAEFLLRSMFDHKALLDLIENFVLFDQSRPGQTRKVVARNHQVLGVNKAVASVRYQEELKKEFPLDQRIKSRVVELSKEEGLYRIYPDQASKVAEDPSEHEALVLPEKAHPDLGKLGVFWHTQGSGKSYSMAFFVEKVRRQIPGNFTFLILTDREDLDGQIHRTFVGCAVADEKTPRAGSGRDLEKLLKENHRFVFTLIHKFRRETLPREPWSMRDDIIVLSDEAHRTQGGKLARVMRTALPNASFLGFTGTPIFKYDQLTKRIFGKYVSKYDFKRAEEDNATVRLVYENRGEKLGIARLDLNDRIAEKIDEASLDSDQESLLEKLMGRDYEVITADDRLKKIADDFVEHSSARWECGKAIIVCVDKVTCGRMLELIRPRWEQQITKLEAQVPEAEKKVAAAPDPDALERAERNLEKLLGRIEWMKETLIHMVISESQNEVKDFKKWGIDIIPHRQLIKQGFTLPDGDTLSVDDAFKKPDHPFRVAIVCAMWLTGFDVECLQTLYIDKPMKAHTLMQAIARANRVYPGKDCGVIVDYNGMLKSLNAALAQYAVAGDDEDSTGGEGPPAIPIEEQIVYLLDAIEATENHLRHAGFEPNNVIGTSGFARINLMADAVSVLYANDETKRRFEILSREVFSRFKPLVTEPVALQFAERHDNIEMIYKRLQQRRNVADVTEILKELHKIVNEVIRAQKPGDDQAEGLTVDLSQIDFEKLKEEFESKVKRKPAAVRDIRDLVEEKLYAMLAQNPRRMDYYKRYTEIVADYNREKDRVTVEETFARLVKLADDLDEEQQRAAREGMTENELALFDLLYRDTVSKKDRERLKQASRNLLSVILEQLQRMPEMTKNEASRADLETQVCDIVWTELPSPPYSDRDKDKISQEVFNFVWQQCDTGSFGATA